MSEPRWPDFELVLWDPKRGGSSTVGAAWRSPDRDQLNIKLNPGVQLNYFDQAVGELKLMLKPFDKQAAEQRRAARQAAGGGKPRWHHQEPPDDDVPF